MVYCAGTKALVVNPLGSYASLRNATLSQSKAPLQLLPGGTPHTPQLPRDSGTALDIEVTIALPPLATATKPSTTAVGGGAPVAFELQARPYSTSRFLSFQNFGQPVQESCTVYCTN